MYVLCLNIHSFEVNATMLGTTGFYEPLLSQKYMPICVCSKSFFGFTTNVYSFSLFLHFRCLKIFEISGDGNFRLGKGLLDDEGISILGNSCNHRINIVI